MTRGPAAGLRNEASRQRGLGTTVMVEDVDSPQHDSLRPPIRGTHTVETGGGHSGM